MKVSGEAIGRCLFAALVLGFGCRFIGAGLGQAPDASRAYVPGIDHNAGACVRGACVIRLNPMPGGYEEYDWKNGWPLIGDKKIVIYGRGVR